MSEVRLGVIGLGNMGGFHAKAALEGKFTRCRLTAVSDMEEAHFKRFPGVRHFKRSEDLIRSGEVDAVIIATPHYSHTTIGADALGSGLHVLVEKPLSVHKKDCEKLIGAHKDKKLIFAAMFNQRTDPAHRKLKMLIDTGELGEIARVNWIITNWFRSEAYYGSGGWRATWKGEGGGVLLNQCPHNLDLLQWFCGMPARVHAFCGFGVRHKIEVEDEVTAYLEYPNGATGVFITSTGEAPGTNRLEITGDRGKVVLENGKLTFTRNETPTSEFSRTTKKAFGRPEIWNIEIPVGGQIGGHNEVTQNFIDAILDGGELIAPAGEGIHSVELANAMLFSTFTGKTVELPLDGDAYERKLMDLIAGSKAEKKADKKSNEAETDNFSNSFK